MPVFPYYMQEMRHYLSLFFIIAFLFSAGVVLADEPEKLEEPVSLPDTTAVLQPKIGSHQSLSYVRPKWYWMPFRWMIKCQNLDLEGQLECGVVYFDIRVRFKKDKVISGHGIIDLDIDVVEALKFLDSRSTEENPLFIHLMYETKPFSKTPELEQLQQFFDQVKEACPRLRFTQFHIKGSYALVESVEYVPKRDCYPYFTDFTAKTIGQKLRGLRFPYPKYFASKRNASLLEEIEIEEDRFYVFDFVDIGVCERF